MICSQFFVYKHVCFASQSWEKKKKNEGVTKVGQVGAARLPDAAACIAPLLHDPCSALVHSGMSWGSLQLPLFNPKNGYLLNNLVPVMKNNISLIYF